MSLPPNRGAAHAVVNVDVLVEHMPALASGIGPRVLYLARDGRCSSLTPD
jgi:hypothetical protein